MITGILKKHPETECEVNVDWTIINILPLLEAPWSGVSSSFTWSQISWFLKMDFCPPDRISLFLRKLKSDIDIPVMFRFGVQLRDGTTETRCSLTKNFANVESGFGTQEFLYASELVGRKHELLPAGMLTVSCSIVRRGLLIIPHSVKYESLDALSSKLRALFDSSENSDVTIVIDEQKYLAHKSILAARSDVFGAMFRHDMEEANSGIIEAPDCEPTSFKDFLLFLYTGKLENLSHSNVYDLYKTANKYNVQDLKDLCIKYIKINLSTSNLLDVVIFANMFKDTDLAVHAQEFFNRNAVEITTRSEWEQYLKRDFPVINQLLINLFLKMEGENQGEKYVSVP